MFKDMDVARDEMRAYNEDKSIRGCSSVDLNVSVISASAWPSYPDVQVTIPRVVASAISDFENFYHKKHTGRKLQWKHQLAHCQLRARFPKETVPKDLVVSSFQAIVLLLFNDVAEGESLSYADLQKATGLCRFSPSASNQTELTLSTADPELKRTLQSLACAKYRVLTKNPKGKEVSTTDQFSWNAGFTDVKRRIKINQIQLKETKEENKTTHERVAADRHYETQAAIVRIMKSRKTIKHAELMAEVIEATRHRGTLQPAEIKTNIEKYVSVFSVCRAFSLTLFDRRLIEKDYMERAEGNKYSYVA